MIGLDTNILIRYVMQDNPQQSAAVAALLAQLTEEEPGYISVATLLELVWVLRSRYRVPKGEQIVVLEHLLRTTTLLLQHEREVSRAFASWQSGPGSFSDVLIAELNAAAGCSTTFTFDQKASRLRGFSLLTS